MSSFFFRLLSIVLYRLFDGVAIISDSLPGFSPTKIHNGERLLLFQMSHAQCGRKTFEAHFLRRGADGAWRTRTKAPPFKKEAFAWPFHHVHGYFSSRAWKVRFFCKTLPSALSTLQEMFPIVSQTHVFAGGTNWKKNSLPIQVPEALSKPPQDAKCRLCKF